MIRPLRAIAMVMLLVAGATRSSAQPSPGASSSPSSNAALEKAKQLNQLVEKLYGEGKFQDAAAPAEQALVLREKTLGRMHPDVAESLNNLAMVYVALGAYDKAEPLYVRALAINEKVFGRGHPEVATNLNNLAELYRSQGAYGKAEPLHIRALDIRKKMLGPMDPDLGSSLNNLAGLYWAQGAYGKAEPLYARALDIHEKALGPMHPLIATSLNNLANLYREQGAYDKAEPLYVRALDIHKKALGPMHPLVATSQDNLAGLYQDQGAYDKAEPLYTRALDIREKTLGPIHPDVARSLNNLAGLYRAQGVYGKAEPLYVRALDIWQKAFGPVHRDVATSLNNLAAVYSAQGAYDKAKPLYVRALDTFEKALGPTHPLVATSLSNLAALYWAQGAYSEAESRFTRAADIQEQQLNIQLTRLPEPRKRALMSLLQKDTDRVVSLHADAMSGNTSALELALTTILQRKGRILDSLVDSETRLRAYLTPNLRDQLDQLSQARSELVAHLYVPTGRRTAADRAAANAARKRIDELESGLSAASADFRTQMESVNLAKIRAALPASAALVEFVRYHRIDPRQAQKPEQEEHYLVYLLTAHGSAQWIALGDAATMDSQIDAVLAAMHRNASGETTKAALRHLDALVLAPIRARLSGVQHLILAPDGKLNLVPFEALVDPQGHYALENYLVSYVTTGRDLLRFAAPRPPRSAATIIAVPDYGPPKSKTCKGLGSLCRLDGALAEVTALQRYFPAPPLTGGKATKSALAALTGPAILHIATHGFYARDLVPLPDHPASATPAQRDHARGMFFVDTPSRSEDAADALDWAGLAMAGANESPSGIVTAREIAGFDWWGTQLVVLSACETGIGAVPSGDGVLGLRRALVLAGAASQVVSLWRVNDDSTSELMGDYYGELARGTGRAEALRRAKLRLMLQPRYSHPYYWAAFIPAGDWGTLDPHAMRRPT